MAEKFTLFVRAIGTTRPPKETFDVLSNEIDPDHQWDDEGVEVSQGAKITVLAHPDDDEEVEYISGNGTPVLKAKKWSDKMPTMNMTVTVKFKKKVVKADKPKADEPKLTTVLIEVEGKGEVTLNVPNNTLAKVGRAFQVAVGETFTIMVTRPSKGFEFARILGGKTIMMMPMQPVKAEGENMTLKVVFEKEAGAVEHDEHHGSTWYKPWTYSFWPWNKSEPAHDPAPATESSAGGGLPGVQKILVRMGIASAIVSVVGLVVAAFALSTEVSTSGVANIAQRHETQRAKAPAELVAACTEAIKASEGTAYGPPAICTSSGSGGGFGATSTLPSGNCADGTIRRGGKPFAVFTAKPGANCVVKVPNGHQVFLRGKFYVANIEGGSVAQFVQKSCDNWEDQSPNDINLPRGSASPSPCTRVSSPSDQASEITLTSSL